ncbi:MAG: DotU family type IV/VI secretion system protein [Noviherbaspirillum sp.]
MRDMHWADQANPPARLFRQAYREFSDAFAEWRRPGAMLAGGDPQAAGRTMLSTLVDIATRLGGSAGSRLSHGEHEQARLLQYAFAALVDEILLNAACPGKSQWNNLLLEDALFQSRLSGERLFDCMKAAMAVRNQESLEIAEVYLHCLLLGFRGKYRDGSHWLEQLGHWREDLFFFVYQHAPDLARPSRMLVEPDDANLVRTAPRQRRLGPRLRWNLHLISSRWNSTSSAPRCMKPGAGSSSTWCRKARAAGPMCPACCPTCSTSRRRRARPNPKTCSIRSCAAAPTCSRRPRCPGSSCSPSASPACTRPGSGSCSAIASSPPPAMRSKRRCRR